MGMSRGRRFWGHGPSLGSINMHQLGGGMWFSSSVTSVPGVGIWGTASPKARQPPAGGDSRAATCLQQTQPKNHTFLYGLCLACQNPPHLPPASICTERKSSGKGQQEPRWHLSDAAEQMQFKIILRAICAALAPAQQATRSPALCEHGGQASGVRPAAKRPSGASAPALLGHCSRLSGRGESPLPFIFNCLKAPTRF